MQIEQAKNKQDFMTFLTDSRNYIEYDNKLFSKEIKGNIIKIKADNELIYEIHEPKQLLIVTNAYYCGYNKDAYWGVASDTQLEEVIADPNTLIRV
ncbi:MAG: hypothetical protein AB9856_15955 [Cellulosilyticaceae bacterium]